MARAYTKVEKNLIDYAERTIKLLRAYIPRAQSLESEYIQQAKLLREQGKLPEGCSSILLELAKHLDELKKALDEYERALNNFKAIDVRSQNLLPKRNLLLQLKGDVIYDVMQGLHSTGLPNCFTTLNQELVDVLLTVDPEQATLLRKEYYDMEQLSSYVLKHTSSIRAQGTNAHNATFDTNTAVSSMSHRQHDWLSRTVELFKQWKRKVEDDSTEEEVVSIVDKKVEVRVGIRKDLVRVKDSHLSALIHQIGHEIEQSKSSQVGENNFSKSFSDGKYDRTLFNMLTVVVNFLSRQVVIGAKTLFSQPKTILYVTITCEGGDKRGSYDHSSTPTLIYTKLNIDKALLKVIIIEFYDWLTGDAELHNDFNINIANTPEAKAAKKTIRHEIIHAFDLGTKDKSAYSLYVETKALIGREPSRLAIAAVNALLTSRSEAITRLAEDKVGAAYCTYFNVAGQHSFVTDGLQTFAKLVHEALDDPSKLESFEKNRYMDTRAYSLGSGLSNLLLIYSLKAPVIFVPSHRISQFKENYHERNALSYLLGLDGITEIPHKRVGSVSNQLSGDDRLFALINFGSTEEYQRRLLQVLKKIHMMDAPTFFQAGKRALEYYGFDVKFSFIEQLKLESKQEEKEMKKLLKHYGL